MNAAEIGATAAVCSVLIAILSALVILAFRAGKHSERLDAHEMRITKVETTQDEHAKAISVWDQALRLLEEVRGDVKNLLTGKVLPARRRAVED